MIPEPFEDSRRLTGCNLYFAGSGAALESARGLPFDDATVQRWRANVAELRSALDWPDGEVSVRRHASGVSLAFAAPMDQLYAATEAIEWAWYDALGQRAVVDPDAPDARPHAATHPRDTALRQLREIAQAEANPALVALGNAAEAHGLPMLPDDDAVSIGMGQGSRTWEIDALPAVDDVPWRDLHAIPAALVTGSNGKTTTVRLLAAMLRAHGLHVSHSCTEGVYFDNVLIEGGDFSGPGGARAALRHPQAQAAVLETARGGVLRRGLALCRADAAVVTNISVDHFGEYGVHDLDDLTRVKLTVAHAVRHDGLLVLNADDPMLQRHAQGLPCPLGWFAAVFDARALIEHRTRGGATCGVRDGRLLLGVGSRLEDLGDVASMPLSLQGSAVYNVGNCAAAALAATALQVAPATIAAVLARFGSAHEDNPGRLQRWQLGSLQVVIDYAHNPDGLQGLLKAVGADRRSGRLAITLGHAGNREDDALRAVAAAAAAFAPDYVVLKDVGGYERGRDPGEIATIMRAELLRLGVPQTAVEVHLDEVEAACRVIAWADPDDLVVLPTFAIAARERLARLLDRMQSQAWQPGDTLPREDEPS